MHIGLDGLPLTTPKTGVGHYTFELAQALAKLEADSRFELLYPSTYPILSLPDPTSVPANLRLKRVRVGLLGRHWWSAGLPRYIRHNGFDLFHGTNYDVPLWRKCANVLTIHDLSPLLHPETHTRRSVRRANRRLPLMVRTADAIITPAETVRRELCEHLNVAPGKVFAIPEAARECFRPMEFAEGESVRRRLGIGDDFLLAVGTIEPRKNLAVLISAFEEVVRTQPASSLQLVIAGGAGWLSGPVFEAIKKSPATKRILLTDYLHDDDLRALYASCGAFIYPSLYEGFGLPPLEAMACGAPVIASDIPIFRETLNKAPHFFDRKNSHQLSEAIIQVTTNQDLRQRLMSAGLRQAQKFSWERTARLTLEVYEAAQKLFVSKQ